MEKYEERFFDKVAQIGANLIYYARSNSSNDIDDAIEELTKARDKLCKDSEV